MSGSTQRTSPRSEELVPGFPFEIQTVNHFLEAMKSGNMPGNNRSVFPTIPSEDLGKFMKPYSEWAPEPYPQLPGAGIGILRVMQHAGGMVDLFTMVSATMPNMEISKRIMKGKIWEGIMPMPESRWKTKELDKQDNIDDALAYIMVVVDVFKHLALPEIQGQLRQSINKIELEMAIFTDAFAAANEGLGRPRQEWDASKLWKEYMIHHLDHMETQARSWVMGKIQSLYVEWKTRMMDKWQSGRVLSPTHGTVIVDHFAVAKLNAIHDAAFEADLYLRVRKEGFHLSDEMDPRFGYIANRDPAEINEIYRRIENERMMTLSRDWSTFITQRRADRQAALPMPEWNEPVGRVLDREVVHRQIQPELENPPVRAVESWIQNIQKPEVIKFGFVIYRLSHEGTDAEWVNVRRKLYAGLNSGWDGVVGVNEAIRLKASLHWIDGKDAKLPANDLEAAKTHFRELCQSPNHPAGLSNSTFLALSTPSMLSYTQTREGDIKGDFRGFVYAVDAQAQPPTASRSQNSETNPTAQPATNASTAEGFPGYVKVLDQLIWPDLYAMHELRHAMNIESMWNLARASKHPWGVYVGPTIASQRHEWKNISHSWNLLIKEAKGRTTEVPARDTRGSHGDGDAPEL